MNEKPAKSGGGAQLLPYDERRRSQRVLVRIPVTLHFVIQGKAASVAAQTVSVNDHGALLICARDLPAGTRLDLENNRTRQQQPCRVSRHPREVPEGFELPVEFEQPAPGFWHISFPPAG